MTIQASHANAQSELCLLSSYEQFLVLEESIKQTAKTLISLRIRAG